MELNNKLENAKSSIADSQERLNELSLENDFLSYSAKTIVVIVDEKGVILQSNQRFDMMFKSIYQDVKELDWIPISYFPYTQPKGGWFKDLLGSKEGMLPKVSAILGDEKYYFTAMLTPISLGEAGAKRYIFSLTDITAVVELHAKEVDTSKELAYKQGIFDITSEYIHNIGNIITGARHHVDRVENNLTPLQQFGSFFDRIKSEVGVVKAAFDDDARTKLEKQFKNIEMGLSIIQSSVQDIAVNTVNEDVSKLKNAIENIAKTISYQQEMYKQTSKADFISEDVDVEPLVRDVVSSVEEQCVNGAIRVDILVEPRLCISTNKINLYNGILNLVTNAVFSINKAYEDKLSDKKLLTIKAYEQKSDNDGFFEIDALEEGDLNTTKTVIIEVSDSGLGMDEETLQKIFVRGFTTKKHGHGLGLHSFGNFLKEHGGTIDARSDGIGKGVDFIVTLTQKVKQND
jgi:signal transduction histidine kinase